MCRLAKNQFLLFLLNFKYSTIYLHAMKTFIHISISMLVILHYYELVTNEEKIWQDRDTILRPTANRPRTEHVKNMKLSSKKVALTSRYLWRSERGNMKLGRYMISKETFVEFKTHREYWRLKVNGKQQVSWPISANGRRNMCQESSKIASVPENNKKKGSCGVPSLTRC